MSTTSGNRVCWSGGGQPVCQTSQEDLFSALRVSLRGEKGSICYS